ncbi:MAG: class I SAM-dependent methyltransferase [Deltaproteobacteria bacterium]|jgi:SAM-dependent methyltransferase|nr:class I SAM-dependent methyltransferase [Deltaproteobacteria bacterium]
MAFNPNQLLNNPLNILNLQGAKPPKAEPPRPPAAPVPAPEVVPAVESELPFDKGLYLDAYSRLGLLRIANVADLGCGAGNFAKIMAEKNQKPELYIGVDQSHAKIQGAKAACPGWRFVYGDFNSEKVKAEYERFEAYLLLNVLDAIEDDLGFLEGVGSGKHLVVSFPRGPREGSLRFFPDNFSLRERYSSLINIKSVGSYRGGGGLLGMVLAERW